MILEGRWKKSLCHTSRQIATEIPSRHFCSHFKFLLGLWGFFHCPALPSSSGFCICTVPFCDICDAPWSCTLWPGASCVFSLAHLSLGPLVAVLCYAEQFSLLYFVLHLYSGAQFWRGTTGSTDFRRSFSDHLVVTLECPLVDLYPKGPIKAFPKPR